MSISDFPIHEYPTVGFTNSNTLYASLGSFWTQIFSEKATLKGYTLAQSEELTQSYLNLIETVNSFSVEDVPIFHTERWFPFRVKKSLYNNVTQLFRSSDDPEYEVFGPQKGTPTDKYYEGVTFLFGYPKTPVAEVYGIDVPTELKGFSILTNRIINPTVVLTAELDYRINSNVCYFNQDIFALSDVPRYNVFDDNGQQVYYTDKQGVSQPEQEIILWAYNADIDSQILFKNFGYVFEINMDNTAFFKEILKSVVSLFVDGPTVQSIRALACAFLGVSPIIETEETIEDSYVTGDVRFVITDKHVYRCDSYYTLLKDFRQTSTDPDTIKKGTKVYAGDVIVDAAEYFDYVQSGDWWRNGLVPKAAYDSVTGVITRYPEMSFPPHLFVGNNKFHFVFKNDLELVTRDSAGNIHFPITGDVTDIAAFHTYINDPVRQSSIAACLGLAVGGSIVINPLEFIFQNFLKHGTALIKLNLANVHQAYVFTTFYSVIKDIFPKHVYLMFYLDFRLDSETLMLNENVTVPINGVSTPANFDGSSSATTTYGYMLPESAANYKCDITKRYFCFSHGLDLTNYSGVPASAVYTGRKAFDGSSSLPEEVVFANVSTPTLTTGSAVKEGTLSIAIPVNASMRDFNTISLLNFS